MRSGILLKMKLASLPRNRRKYALSGSFQTNVIIADNQLQSMKPPDDRRLQELTPIPLRFRKLYTHAQHTAATTLRDSVRNQRGSVHHRIILVTDFFVPGVQQQIFDGLRQ